MRAYSWEVDKMYYVKYGKIQNETEEEEEEKRENITWIVNNTQFNTDKIVGTVHTSAFLYIGLKIVI